MDLFEKLSKLREKGLTDIKNSKTEQELNDARVRLLGKKRSVNGDFAFDEGCGAGAA